MPPVTLYWHDGFSDPARPQETQNFPPRPEGIGPDVKLGDGRNGSYFVGEKGILTAGSNGGNPRLLPEELNNDYKRPEPTIPRIRLGDEKRWGDNDYQHKQDWIRAIKNGGPEPCSNFAHSGPLTEFVLAGNVALRGNGPIEWDARNMRATNNPEANIWVSKQYPEGWCS